MWISNVLSLPVRSYYLCLAETAPTCTLSRVLWGCTGTSEGTMEKCLDLGGKNSDGASQIILLPASFICVVYTHAHALPYLSLISERLNLRCSVERLPADTHHQIKSFTVESKEFSLSLHKHESNGGGGLRWMWASSHTPSGSCILELCVLSTRGVTSSKITAMYSTLSITLIQVGRVVAIL